MWKWNDLHVTSVGQRKIESQTEFKPMTSQTPGGRSIQLSYGELMESEAIYTRFILLFILRDHSTLPSIYFWGFGSEPMCRIEILSLHFSITFKLFNRFWLSPVPSLNPHNPAHSYHHLEDVAIVYFRPCHNHVLILGIAHCSNNDRFLWV